MMRFDIVTLFPEMPLLIEKFGITARASKLGLWQLKCWNPRDFVFDAHKTVDDRPFGGRPGHGSVGRTVGRCSGRDP